MNPETLKLAPHLRVDIVRPPWKYPLPTPVSLLDMLQWLAGNWVEIVRNIESLKDPADWRITSALLNGESISLLQVLAQIKDYCDRAEMELTRTYCQHIIFGVKLYSGAVKGQPGYVSPYQPADFADEMKILSDRFYDELKNETFLTFEHKGRKYFRKPELFGEQVSEKFPSVSIDIEEAGNCFALNR